jgi:5'-phosphate synthase pdxT subunit
MNIKPGILSFQGDVEEHQAAFSRLGYDAIRVKTTQDLKNISHLVIPGGESTVMSKLLTLSGLDKEIIYRVKTKKDLKIFGTCAGLIIISGKVNSKIHINNLSLIDLETSRNAYGSQINSFEKEVYFLSTKQKFVATFIRAPKVDKVGEEVQILARDSTLPILFQHKNVLASTFHPEYLEEPFIHQYFLDL